MTTRLLLFLLCIQIFFALCYKELGKPSMYSVYKFLILFVEWRRQKEKDILPQFIQECNLQILIFKVAAQMF